MVCCSYHEDKWAKPGNLLKSNVSKIWEPWVVKYCHFAYLSH